MAKTNILTPKQEQPAIKPNRIDRIPPEKRFQPGVSGNPNGRPKNSVTTLLKAKPDSDKKAIATKLTDMAKEGDLKAIDMFIDRTDGRVIQQTDVTFAGEGLSDVLLKLRGYNPNQIEEGEQCQKGYTSDTVLEDV